MANMKPTYNDLGKNTPTKKKLLSKIHQHYPDLDEKETANMLISIKRFVNVVRKMRTEPQLQIIYKDVEYGGKIGKHRIIQTDIEELAKVAEKNDNNIKPALDKLFEYLPKQKHGKRSKKI